MPKYRVGDKVSVEYTVRMSDDKGGSAKGLTEYMGSVFVTDQHGNKTCVPINKLTSHTPAPWKPKVGDEVVFRTNPVLRKIIFIDDKSYVVEDTAGYYYRYTGGRARFDGLYKRA